VVIYLLAKVASSVLIFRTSNAVVIEILSLFVLWVSAHLKAVTQLDHHQPHTCRFICH